MHMNVYDGDTRHDQQHHTIPIMYRWLLYAKKPRDAPKKADKHQTAWRGNMIIGFKLLHCKCFMMRMEGSCLSLSSRFNSELC